MSLAKKFIEILETFESMDNQGTTPEKSTIGKSGTDPGKNCD